MVAFESVAQKRIRRQTNQESSQRLRQKKARGFRMGLQIDCGTRHHVEYKEAAVRGSEQGQAQAHSNEEKNEQPIFASCQAYEG